MKRQSVVVGVASKQTDEFIDRQSSLSDDGAQRTPFNFALLWHSDSSGRICAVEEGMTALATPWNLPEADL